MPIQLLDIPSREWLRDKYVYDPDTGLLTYKASGKVASHHHNKGYHRVTINNRWHLAHRVIWKMMVSDIVPDQIDHINGNKADNRIENMRAAEHAQNIFNQNICRANTSGFKGVSHAVRGSGRWRAYITAGGIRHELGHYGTKEEAHAAYVEAAKRLHGEFANDGHGPICK